MNIPFFSLHRQWNNLKKIISPALEAVLESQWYIGGKEVQTFEKNFASYVHSTHAISCNSGTDALWLALKALELQPGALVITTPFSFIASSSEIFAHGATPVFIDIDESTYNISPHKINTWLKQNAVMRNGKAIHKNTNAPIVGIVAVNIFGHCANYQSLRTLTHEWNLWLVEDAAQSIGSTYQNQSSGSLGDISCFSFYPTKNLGAFGDAGIITTNNELLAHNILRLKNHGRQSHYAYSHYGINSRMDALQAAVLNKKLEYIDGLNQRRHEIATRYTKSFTDLPFIKTPQEKIDSKHIYHQYCIRVIDENGTCYRKTLVDHLQNVGIQTRIFYPEGLHTIPYLSSDEHYRTACPIAEQATESILALPIWPEMTNEEVDYVCEQVKSLPYGHVREASDGKQPILS